MRRPVCVAALLYCFVILICLALSPPKEADDSAWDREEITVQGTVAEKEYKRKDDGSLILLVTLKKCSIQQSSFSPEVTAVAGEQEDGIGSSFLTANVLCRVGDGSEENAAWSDEHSAIGSTVQVRGTARTFAKATNDGEFDSRRYYRTLGYTVFSLNQAEITAWENPETAASHDPVGNGLYRLKRHLAAVLDESVPEEDAGILKAMLLGEKGSLSSGIRELYQESGIIHILAISGLHISIIGMGLYRLFRRMKIPLPPSAAAAVAVMILYGKMTGMGASSFRAICMFLLHMTALVLHRTYDLLTALSLAGVLLLLQQPLYLLDSGFQFSFGAVLGIALLSPAFESKVMKTLAVTLAVIPVYLISYGTFPIYSILLNLAVLPLMSVVMLSGLGTLAAGCILPALGRGAGAVTHLILLFYKTLCQLSMRLPGHQMNVGAPEAWEIVFYLGALAAMVCAKDFLPEMVKAGTVAASLMILCLRVQSGLDVYVLDVGQGDGLLIRQGGMNILIDGGSTSKSSLSQYQLTPFLTNRGISRLDYCIVTHEDEDHMNGVIEVIRESRTHRDGAAGFLLDDSSNGITVGALCLPSCDPELQGGNYQLLLDAAEEKKIPVLFLSEGVIVPEDRGSAEQPAEQYGSEDAAAVRGLTLTCLHPEKDSRYDEANERSVVLELTYGKFSMLLTGDLEGGGEKRLLEYLKSSQEPQQAIGVRTGDLAAAESEPAGGEERAVTLLKVAHHGSSGATSREFLDAVSPRYAVISCGVNNRYHHPSQETLERLEESGVQKIYDTRYGGEICFHTDGEKLTVREKGGELD